MRHLFNFFLFVLICFSLTCCFIVRPRKIVEEPIVSVTILWDTDTIFISSKNSYTVSNKDKIITIDANTELIITKSAELRTGQDKIVVLKPNKKEIMSSPDKIIFESPDELTAGKNSITTTTYRKKIEIKKGVVHRFPTQKDLTAVNVLPIEEYLYGVVSCEIGMAKEQELEAAKAQAVCARSYTMALLGKRKDFDLYASYLYDQEYQGKSREYKLSIKAVEETRGEIMNYKDEPILAQYHACCGGRTTNGRYPYLQSIVDASHHSRHEKPYCQDSPYFEWTVKIPRTAFEDSILRLVGIKYKFKLNLKLDINKTTKRVDYLKFEGDKEYKIPGESIRKAFNLKSTFFTVKIKNDTTEISGHGWGHGIGMCQYGALEMARQKISYKNILRHYYSGIKLVRIY